MKIKRIVIGILCIILLSCQVLPPVYANELNSYNKSETVFLNSRLRIFDTDKSIQIEMEECNDIDFSSIKVSMEIGNSNYTGTYTGTIIEGDCLITIYHQYLIKLPQSYKAGTPYKITAEYSADEFKESITGTVIDSSIIPNLSIDAKPTYQSKYIAGMAQKDSEVSLRIGEQSCSVPATNGRYKLSFDRRYKVGTKYEITCKSALNDRVKTIRGKIGKPNIKIVTSKKIRKKSKKISGAVRGSNGSEYIIATVNGKNYKAKIKSNQKFSIKLPKLNNTKSIKLKVYNKFKQVVYSSKIKVRK